MSPRTAWVWLATAWLLLSGSIPADAEAASMEPVPEQQAGPIALDDFFRHPEVENVKISPSGEYLAAAVRVTGDRGGLVIVRRADNRRTGVFSLRDRSFVDDFRWVSDKRLVLSTVRVLGSRKEAIIRSGELFGVDYDGRRREVLLSPFRGTPARRKYGFLVDTIAGEDEHVLVSIHGFKDQAGGLIPRLERLNVNTGSRSLIAAAPMRRAEFLADARQRARLAWADSDANRQRVYYRGVTSTQWALINDESESGHRWTPHFIYPDGASALIERTETSGPNALYRYEFETGRMTMLLRDEHADPMLVAFDERRSHPVAVTFLDGRPKLVLLDQDSALVAAWTGIQREFPEQFAIPTSQTRDGSLTVFRVASDRNPGAFVLFDRSSGRHTPIQSSRPWLRSDDLAAVEPIALRARDGLRLSGYLTLPNVRPGAKPPLVVIPHGGPIGVFDQWGFDEEAQFLASRGYATLHINFRGSGNFGEAFLRAGFGQWGDRMIDDITDAVRWVIAEDRVDPDRICIFGASYGGYAAAQSAIREPDLYRCGVGYVGVYDLPLLLARVKSSYGEAAQRHMIDLLGADVDALKRISPVHNAERLQIPFFIAAGNLDQRAPAKHSIRLRDAMSAAGNPPAWMLKDDEGHGFVRLDNMRAFYSELLAFLDTHLPEPRRAVPTSRVPAERHAAPIPQDEVSR